MLNIGSNVEGGTVHCTRNTLCLPPAPCASRSYIQLMLPRACIIHVARHPLDAGEGGTLCALCID